MAEKPTIHREPADRLTRICDAMSKTFDMHPEHRPDDKCVVFLNGSGRGGVMAHGYEDDLEPLVDLLYQIKIMFEANGKRVDYMFLDEDGIDRA